jgi:CheY-like chemotaxis protein
MVFMDIEMPEMNGLDATREITGTCPVPVILLSAHDDPDLVEEGSRAGAAAYLVKPPSLGEMVRTMAVARARFADFMLIQRANEELRKSLRDIRVLRGLLPICNRCQRIRNAAGHWQRVDDFFSSQTNFQFIQTICPTCVPKLDEDRPHLQPKSPAPEPPGPAA